MMAKIITKDTKPGKGISKDEPEKRRFFLFFEIYFSKFFKLVSLNFIYFLCLMPLFFGIYYSVTVNPLVVKISDIAKFPPIVFTPSYLGLGLILASFFVTGPATAGFTYVIRNMQRREHTWVISDFFEHFKKNFKQGVAMSIIDFFGVLVLYVAIAFYLYIMPTDAPEMGNVIPIAGAVFNFVISIIFLWVHYYIYTMMVTFKLGFSRLFKNAVIFALAKAPLNLLITFFIAVVAVLVSFLMSFAGIVIGFLIPTVILSLIGFIVVFSTYPTIDKVMLEKVNKRVLSTRG